MPTSEQNSGATWNRAGSKRASSAPTRDQSPGASELQVAVEVELALDGVRWKNLTVDTALSALPSEHLHLTHSGALVDNRLLVEDLAADLDWAHLEADGDVALDLSERSTLNLRDLTVNLGAMRSALAGTGVALPPQVAGAAQLTAVLDGSLDALHLQLHTRTRKESTRRAPWVGGVLGTRASTAPAPPVWPSRGVYRRATPSPSWHGARRPAPCSTLTP